MKRLMIVFLATAGLTSAAIAGAQVSQPETQQPPSSQTEPRTTPSTQTRGVATSPSWIGCVEKGTTPNSYMLNVTERPSGATGTVGTTATGDVKVGEKVMLMGDSKANLSSHVGHKVEIKGTIAPGIAGTAGTPGAAAKEPRVNVTDVRMIAATCTPAPSTPGTSGTGESGTAGTSGATSRPEPSQPSTEKEKPNY